MVKFVEAMKLIFMPSVRRKIDRAADQASKELKDALDNNSREFELFRRALREGPRLRLVTEPCRNPDGTFAAKPH